MGYYVSSMIGIRTGGVFSGKTDIDDFKSRIRKVIKQIEKDGGIVDIDKSLSCVSSELSAHKGNYVVIAGVFNYWSYDQVKLFAEALSTEFGTEIMVMTWDEEQNTIQCNIFLDGESLFEVTENPIGRIIRRVC